MFTDGQGLPVAGSAVFVALLYAGVSMFITGPLIGERMVEKMDWGGQCARQIHAEVAAAEPAAPITPKLGCDELFGNWFGSDGAEFCGAYGDQFDNNPISRSLNAAETAERAAQQQRMDYAVSRAGSRCECAVTTTLEERRMPFAIHAGSARFITPPSVRMLASDLEAALNTPACAMKG